MTLFLFLCSILVSTVSSTAFGNDAAVVTSEDVWTGLTEAKMNLTVGEHNQYRVYGVYASSGNENYAKNVLITGVDGTLTLAALATPKANSEYLLDIHILTPPFTISDNNPATARIPFTFYIVAAKSANGEVVSAKLAGGKVSCQSEYTQAACIVLSAEKNFQLESIDLGAAPSIIVANAGSDADRNVFAILTVTLETVGSSVLVSGPIATLWTGTTINQAYSFNFVIKKGAPYSGSMTPGASTTFLSNGWLTFGESYALSYQDDNLRSRNIDFGKETTISLFPVLGNFKNQDGLQLSCKHDNGQISTYDGRKIEGVVTFDYCKQLSLTVTTTKTTDQPRFMVQISSGLPDRRESTSTASSTSMTTTSDNSTGATSVSLLAVIIVSLMGRLFG